MNAENVEQLSLFEGEEQKAEQSDSTPEAGNDFEELVYARMRKIYNDGMIVGFQTACNSVLDRIYAFERSTGKKSTNDYKRCLKDLKQFCEVGVSRKVNTGETTDLEESVEPETAQN